MPQKGGWMGPGILLEEYPISVYAPRGLPEAEYEAMNRTLTRRRFRARLQRVLQRIVQQHPSLLKSTIKVSR
jgi:hypothetical protein